MFCINFEIDLAECEGPLLLRLAFEIDFEALCITGDLCQRGDTQQNAHTDSVFVDFVRNLVASNPDAFDLCVEGTGGTYFVKDLGGKRVAVFKPVDEEPGASGNPKKLISDPILPYGGGAVREVAAFLIDKGRAGVPETTIFDNVLHDRWASVKTGSLQRYVPHKTVAADMGSSLFSVDNVHAIGLLDIRLLNLDRNGENMLVVADGSHLQLVPIDHSYILPPSIMTPIFEWQYWKQSKVPFSKETLRFIDSIDTEEDAKTLRGLGLPDECIRTMKITTLLLKQGAAHNLNLFQIASLVCAEEGKKSELALVVEKAESLCTGNELFFSVIEKLIEDVVCRASV